MNEKHTISKLGKSVEKIDHKIAFSNGKGSNKSLIIRILFDGNGNETVRYVVEDHGVETHHPDFDLAVEHYNTCP
jgi:hypothetical protein